MRLSKTTKFLSRASESVLAKVDAAITSNLPTSITSRRPSMKTLHSYQQHVNRSDCVPPVRGKELFIRSIHRIIERIQEKKKETLTFTDIEDAIVIFHDLTIAKCIPLKKKLLDPENRSWTLDFADLGGLRALLSYLEEVTNRNLSLTDAVLVNEALQCLRAMMNIEQIFEHILDDPQYIDSITKVLNVRSAEIRTRVFELLIALCVYSADGYELVLKAFKNFQTENKLSNIFAVILEQMGSSMLPKHKWSALALLNTIISSTESIEKRLLYRKILFSNGFIPILEQAKTDEDEDLYVQIEVFYDAQERDEAEFRQNCDNDDHQDIHQAIELQLGSDSEGSALFVTVMQALYTNVIQAEPKERTALLQKLLDMLLLMNEKPITKETREKAAQTDFEVVAAAPANKPSPSLSVKDPAPAFVPPPPPPSAPPFVLTSLPPPPLPDSFMSGPQKPKFEGLSALLDKIPKPKNTTRRLQWKKLTEIVLKTSQFWKDVNGDIDERVDFDHLDNNYKVKQTKVLRKTEKKKDTILSKDRLTIIGVFLKKYKFTDVDLFLKPLIDPNSNQDIDFFKIFLTKLPKTDEIALLRNVSPEGLEPEEQFFLGLIRIPAYELRIQSKILKCEFSEMFESFERKFQKIRTVMNFILNNSSLKHLARTVLSIGDFLNHGSFAGDAFGFRLESINQLTMIRSETNETLLSLLLEICPENFEFVIELKSLLTENVTFKENKIEYLSWKSKILNDFEDLKGKDAEVVEEFKTFYEKSIKTLETQIDPLINECDSKEAEILKEFGETDAKDFNYNICCSIFRQFISQVQKEQNEREKRNLAKKRETNRVKKLGSNETSKENLIDQLMIEVRGGRMNQISREKSSSFVDVK